MTPERGGRFYSLDVLRGVAALTVVFFHWRHFFYEGTTGSMEPARQPFFAWLHPLYMKGWLAVDLFFALSGFIFYFFYAGRVAAGEIRPREFFILRFSRLYPLHFATLLAVAAGQLAFQAQNGSYFVNGGNDAYHFALHLLFASSWGFERSLSFNAPVWSVSVEVLLYAAFFVLCRLLPVRLLLLAALSAAGFWLALTAYGALGRGIGSFFLGGCVCLAYRRIVAAGRAHSVARTLALPVAVLWLLVLGWPDGMARLPLPQGIGGEWLVILVLFPLTILVLALAETALGGLGRRFAVVGELSYASYLLHFPLQVAVVMGANAMALKKEVFYEPAALIGFMVFLIAVSLASYRWFELPAQRYLRQRLLAPRAAHA